MREEINNPRDRCIFELLINTGQRLTAVRTLRRKDISLDKGKTGCFRLNPNSDGLKGADKTGQWKPLFGAKAAVREWMNEYHPVRNDPNAYLITQRPGWQQGKRSGEDEDKEVYGMLSGQYINTVLKRIADQAGVTKPANAHNFRHTAVTMLKRDYNQDNDFIKWYMGHKPDSKVFETTYRHLTDEDFRKQGEADAGFREEERDSPLTPSICPTCSNQLEPDDVACNKCGEIFTASAEAAQDMVEDKSFEGMRDADDDSEAESVANFREFLKENPKKAVEIMREDL